MNKKDPFFFLGEQGLSIGHARIDEHLQNRKNQEKVGLCLQKQRVYNLQHQETQALHQGVWLVRWVSAIFKGAFLPCPVCALQFP